MKAADVMTKAVVTLPPNAPITDALRLMLGQRISGLPVVDANGRLVGILTEGDLLRRAEIGTEPARSGWRKFVRGASGEAEDFVRTNARRVDELMTKDVVTASESTPLEEIVALMERKHIKRVAIVDDGKLVGIVSRSDLLRSLASALDQAVPVPVGDAAIRKAVETQLGAHPWCRGNRVDTVVADGVVFLEGFVFDQKEHQAIRVAAENVPGVKAVEDHIEYVDPNYISAYGM